MVTQGTRTPADEEDKGSDIDGGYAAMNNEENEYMRGESDDEDKIHQEKRFCAPKSRQKSQHFTTSLDSVWLHLNSVWVSLSS